MEETAHLRSVCKELEGKYRALSDFVRLLLEPTAGEKSDLVVVVVAKERQESVHAVELTREEAVALLSVLSVEKKPPEEGSDEPSAT